MNAMYQRFCVTRSYIFIHVHTCPYMSIHGSQRIYPWKPDRDQLKDGPGGAGKVTEIQGQRACYSINDLF